MDWLQAPASLRRWHALWNGLEAAPALPSLDSATLAEWRACVQAARARLLTPAVKFAICKAAPGFIFETMEALGGNGYVEEGLMPRLYREAPVNAIWEGSGNVVALDLLRAHPDGHYALVLMDMQMPVLDGIATTEVLRREPRFAALPIVAMTANAMPADRERCLAAGIDEYVTKPVALDDLAASLGRALRVPPAQAPGQVDEAQAGRRTPDDSQ